MALRKLPKRLPEDDPRRAGHETTYQASRGGWFPKTKTPASVEDASPSTHRR